MNVLVLCRDCWFLVDCRWLDAWAEYVQYIPPKMEDEGESSDNTDGDRSVSSPLDGTAESELRNSEPELEPALPGPISTRDLLSADGKTPLPNLTAKVDYRGVPSMVYCIFVELYGKDSSPEICRYLVDIYKAPVPEDKLVKIKLNAVVGGYYLEWWGRHSFLIYSSYCSPGRPSKSTRFGPSGLNGKSIAQKLMRRMNYG